MPPPSTLKRLSFDCSFSIAVSLPFHQALTIIISVFWSSLMAITIITSSFLGSQRWHLKFFWGSVCDGILSFLGLCVMPWWAAGSSTDWLPSLGSHLRLFSLARSQFYRISKYFGGNLIYKCLTGSNESNHKQPPVSCFRHPVPKELQSTVYRAAFWDPLHVYL